RCRRRSPRLPLLCLDRELVERQPPVAHAVAQQRDRLLRVLAFAAGAREPGGEIERVLEDELLFDLEAGALDEPAPLLLRVVADVRGVAQLLGALEVVAAEDSV